MTTGTNWHATDDVLQRYSTGALDEARASSVEAHLLSCEPCREALRGTAGVERLDGVWGRVESRLDHLELGPVERFLIRLGMPDHVARLLMATPSLRLSWFGAISLALGFTVAAARVGHGQAGTLVFLILAPLLPLAGVAVAFGPRVDPTYEVGLAAPMRGDRLLFVRAVAVLSTSTVVLGAASLALPGIGWMAVAWLLPSLALSSLCLALSTAWSPLVSAGLVATVWIAVTILAAMGSRTDFAAFRAPEQVLFASILAASLLVLQARREAFDRKGTL